MAETREERIMKLATSLKASGFAKTDSQARMLAEDMIGTEDKVQKKYEEQHSQVQEFLKTAKNLKEDRTLKPEQKKESVQIQPIRQEPKHIQSFDEEANEEVRHLQEIKKEPHHGSQSLSSMMLGQMEEEHHQVKTIEEINEEHHHVKPDFNFSGPIVEEPKQEEIVVEERPIEEEKTIEEAPVVEEKIVEEKTIEESTPQLEPSLDANKLVEMMEEDGKMEEHTREIKEKPKNIKPKEEYAENNIDLGAIFGAKK